IGSSEEIEHQILMREARDHLTESEWIVCNLKMMGYSSEEIATRRSSSTAAVDMGFSPAQQKLRRVLCVQRTNSPEERASTVRDTTVQTGPHSAETEKADGESPES